MFGELSNLLFSADIMDKHKGIIGIRKIVSVNDCPPIFLIFEHGILAEIVEFMNQQQYPQLIL